VFFIDFAYIIEIKLVARSQKGASKGAKIKGLMLSDENASF